MIGLSVGTPDHAVVVRLDAGELPPFDVVVVFHGAVLDLHPVPQRAARGVEEAEAETAQLGAAGLEQPPAVALALEPGRHAAVPTGIRLALPAGTEMVSCCWVWKRYVP